MTTSMRMGAAALVVLGCTATAKAQKAEPAALPPVTGSLFTMFQPEKLSFNFTGIASFNIPLSKAVAFGFSVRNDWVNLEPGALRSQFWGMKDLFLSWRLSDSTNLRLGTMDYTGPWGSEPDFGKNGLRGLWGYGGPAPGFVGVQASNQSEIGGMPLRTKFSFGTGDRFVTPSFAGTDFPALCWKASALACGPVAGIDMTVTPAAGIGLNGQYMFIGNGHGLRDEHHFSLGGKIELEFLNMKWTGVASANHIRNYKGSAQDLNALTGTLTATKSLGDFAVGVNLSQTVSAGAVRDNWPIVGGEVAYNKGNLTLYVDPFLVLGAKGRAPSSGVHAGFVYKF